MLERSSSEKSTMSLGLQVERDRSPEDFGVAFELRKKGTSNFFILGKTSGSIYEAYTKRTVIHKHAVYFINW